MNLTHTKVWHDGSVALTSSDYETDDRANLGPHRTYVRKAFPPHWNESLFPLHSGSLTSQYVHSLGKPPCQRSLSLVLSLMTTVSLSLSEHATFQQNLNGNWKRRGWNALFKTTQPDFPLGDPRLLNHHLSNCGRLRTTLALTKSSSCFCLFRTWELASTF